MGQSFTRHSRCSQSQVKDTYWCLQALADLLPLHRTTPGYFCRSHQSVSASFYRHGTTRMHGAVLLLPGSSSQVTRVCTDCGSLSLGYFFAAADLKPSEPIKITAGWCFPLQRPLYHVLNSQQHKDNHKGMLIPFSSSASHQEYRDVGNGYGKGIRSVL